MSINIFGGLFSSQAKDFIFHRFGDDQVPAETKSEEVAANERYIELVSEFAWIPKLRKGFTRFHKATYSEVSLPTLDANAVFQTLSTPKALQQMSPDDLSRVIQLRHRLFGPVPYRGGDLSLQLGVYAIKEKDLAQPFLELVSTFADLGTASFLSTAKSFATPITNAVNALTGASDDVSLEIGINQLLTSSTGTVRTGYYLVIGAERKDIDPSKLKLDPSKNSLLDAAGNDIKKFPYIVFRLTSTDKHATWFQIPEIKESYQAIRRAIGQDRAKAELLVKAFRPLAMVSNDLLMPDGERLAGLVQKEFEAVHPPGGTGGRGLAPKKMRDLDRFTLF
jgi:hypothetical protein